MPIYALILIMYVPSEPINIYSGNSLFIYPNEIKKAILIYYFLLSVICPGFLYIVLQKLNIIKTIEMNDQKERKIPMIIMSISCLILFYLFTSINATLPKYVYALCLSGATIISIFTFVNLYMKVSLHATGVGIFTGVILAYVSEQIYFELWLLILAFIISGVVLTTRLYLEKHTPKELIIGYFFSLIVTFVFNYYYPLR